MIGLKIITILVLVTAAFLNAVALGEQYGLKRATKKTVFYRATMFAVDLCLAALVARQ